MSETVGDRRPRPEASHDEQRSLYEKVMADPDTKHAYFNTTQGMLTGNPSHQDMDAILELLDDNKIVYLYDPDANRPRPTFYSPGRISIGLAEISQAAKRLASTS